MEKQVNETYFPKGTVIRVDDISINLDFKRLDKFLHIVKVKYPSVNILLAVSPMVFDMNLWEPGHEGKRERVFPSILNAKSDHRVYFEVEKIGIPEWLHDIVKKYNCQLATHGLIHVDHRMLSKELQEMSIIASSSLVKSKIFVPPFNKYNQDTFDVCKEFDIKIVRWEDGWIHLGYHPFSNDNNKYYVHLHDYPGEKLFSLIP